MSLTDEEGMNLLLDFRCAVHKLMAPELKVVVADELDECDEESPRMGSVHDQTLQQHSGEGIKDRSKIRMTASGFFLQRTYFSSFENNVQSNFLELERRID